MLSTESNCVTLREPAHTPRIDNCLIHPEVFLRSRPPVLGRRFTWRPNLHVRMTPTALAAKRAVDQKMRDGTYAFEDRSCFCGSAEDLLLATRDFYGLLYPIVVCRRCGLIRANPRLTERSYAEFYDQEYRSVYGEDDSQLDRYFSATLEQGRLLYDAIVRDLTDTGLITRGLPRVVVDIGCNMGAMLVPWKQAGAEVYGIDLSQARIAAGKELTGLANLYAGGTECLACLPRKADLIILHHVFEHLVDLDKEMAAIRPFCAAEAVLRIDVPGTYQWVRRHCGGDIMGLLQNAHTYQFTLETLTYVMECLGFALVKGNQEIGALFRVSDRRRERCDVPVGEFERVMRHLRRTEAMHAPRRYLKDLAELLGVREPLGKWLRKTRVGSFLVRSNPHLRYR